MQKPTGKSSFIFYSSTPYRYISDETFGPLETAVMSDGFGFIEYPGTDRLGLKSYGLSISLPSWVLGIVERMDAVRVIDYTERGWDNHQDVLILRKVPLIAHPWIFEDRASP